MTAEPTTYKRVPQELVERAIGQLALHPRNPKDHDIGALTDSIGDGFYGAIVILKKPLKVLGVECPEGKQWVLAGHGRIETLVIMGASESVTVPCIEVDVSALKAGSILLGDNRISQLGGFLDHKLLEALKAQLETARDMDADMDAALKGTGYDLPFINDLAGLMSAPSLAEQRAAHGEPKEGDDWPTIKLPVPESTFRLYARLMALAQLPDDAKDHQRLAWVLERAATLPEFNRPQVVPAEKSAQIVSIANDSGETA